MTGMHRPPPLPQRFCVCLCLSVPVSAEQGPGRGRRSSYRPVPERKSSGVKKKPANSGAPPHLSPPFGSILPIIFLPHIFFASVIFFLHVPQSERVFAPLKQTKKRNTARRSIYSLDTWQRERSIVKFVVSQPPAIDFSPSIFLRGVHQPPPFSHAIAKIGDSVRSAIL